MVDLFRLQCPRRDEYLFLIRRGRLKDTDVTDCEEWFEANVSERMR